MTTDTQDARTMKDFEKAKELAARCTSPADVSALYLMIYEKEPQIAQQFTEIFHARQAKETASEPPPPRIHMTHQEIVRCFLRALEIGRHAKSSKALFDSIPQNTSDEVKIRTMVWASAYYSLMQASTVAYNLIKDQHPNLISEFENLAETVLIEIERGELERGKLSLADLCDYGFNIDNESADTLREFSRLTNGKRMFRH